MILVLYSLNVGETWRERAMLIMLCPLSLWPCNMKHPHNFFCFPCGQLNCSRGQALCIPWMSVYQHGPTAPCSEIIFTLMQHKAQHKGSLGMWAQSCDALNIILVFIFLNFCFIKHENRWAFHFFCFQTHVQTYVDVIKSKHKAFCQYNQPVAQCLVLNLRIFSSCKCRWVFKWY